MPSAGEVLLRSVTEEQFQNQVLELARLTGWTCYHTWLAAHSSPGFPDLVLVRPPRLVFAELKSERGKVSPAQERWLQVLADCQGVEVRLWRPSDWHNVEETLKR